MELELAKATQFQEFIYSLSDYVEYIPYQKVQLNHILITAVIIVCSFISYRLGKKKENNNFLSEQFKKRLDDFEHDVQNIKKRIDKNEGLIDKIIYFQLFCVVVLGSYLVYQGMDDYTDIKMILGGLTLFVTQISLYFYKNHLNSQIKQLSFKIQEDLNSQQQIMKKLLSEMSDKMKKILCDMVSQQILKESEIEKENIRKQYEIKIKGITGDSEIEKDALKKRYESRINTIMMQNENSKSLCKAAICKKKRKMLKEKLKRSDWFIRNLSEFAWCSICASNMYEDPAQSFILDNNVSDQSINLDDSIMLNTTVADESVNDETERLALFNRLQASSSGEVIKKECENNCLSKYFFLCKKIGEKYNQWTDLIEKFESKYKVEKQKVKQLNGISQ